MDNPPPVPPSVPPAVPPSVPPPPPPVTYQSFPTQPPPPPKKSSRVWLWVIIGIGVLCLLCLGVSGIAALIGFNAVPSIMSTAAPRLTEIAPTTEALIPQVDQQGVSHPFIVDVILATGVAESDYAPVGETTVFGPEQTVHAVVEIEDAPEDTAFKAVWYVTDVGDAAPPDSYIAEYEMTTGGSRYIDFSLEPNNPWPVGLYRMELFVNNELDRVVEFSVE